MDPVMIMGSPSCVVAPVVESNSIDASSGKGSLFLLLRAILLFRLDDIDIF